MNIAVLLLAHKNKEQLSRLFQRMKHPNIDFFVHVDAKSDLVLEDSNHVHILTERYDVELFSFEMVKATLSLIKLAWQTGKYHYFILMSGQDYPLLPTETIVNTLTDHYPMNYIDLTPAVKGNWVDNSFRRSNCFKKARAKIHKKIGTKKKHHFTELLLKSCTILPLKYLSYLTPAPKKVMQKHSYLAYGGRQWWIMSDKAVSSVAEWYEKAPNSVKKALRRVGSPDETFFQTCYVNAGVPNTLDQEKISRYYHGSPTFVRFNNQGHASVMTVAEYDELTASGMLFGRKFDLTVDRTIFDRLDETNNAENEATPKSDNVPN